MKIKELKLKIDGHGLNFEDIKFQLRCSQNCNHSINLLLNIRIVHREAIGEKFEIKYKYTTHTILCSK